MSAAQVTLLVAGFYLLVVAIVFARLYRRWRIEQREKRAERERIRETYRPATTGLRPDTKAQRGGWRGDPE